MPAPVVYVLAIVGTVGAVLAFKEFVFHPHIEPTLDRWKAEFQARRRDRALDQQAVPMMDRRRRSGGGSDTDGDDDLPLDEIKRKNGLSATTTTNKASTSQETLVEADADGKTPRSKLQDGLLRPFSTSHLRHRRPLNSEAQAVFEPSSVSSARTVVPPPPPPPSLPPPATHDATLDAAPAPSVPQPNPSPQLRLRLYKDEPELAATEMNSTLVSTTNNTSANHTSHKEAADQGEEGEELLVDITPPASPRPPLLPSSFPSTSTSSSASVSTSASTLASASHPPHVPSHHLTHIPSLSQSYPQQLDYEQGVILLSPPSSRSESPFSMASLGSGVGPSRSASRENVGSVVSAATTTTNYGTALGVGTGTGTGASETSRYHSFSDASAPASVSGWESESVSDMDMDTDGGFESLSRTTSRSPVVQPVAIGSSSHPSSLQPTPSTGAPPASHSPTGNLPSYSMLFPTPSPSLGVSGNRNTSSASRSPPLSTLNCPSNAASTSTLTRAQGRSVGPICSAPNSPSSSPCFLTSTNFDLYDRDRDADVDTDADADIDMLSDIGSELSVPVSGGRAAGGGTSAAGASGNTNPNASLNSATANATAGSSIGYESGSDSGWSWASGSRAHASGRK